MSTSRRAPLASISHATNSPHRSLAHSGTKRSRQTYDQENEPPLKKQVVDRQRTEASASPRKRIPPPTTAEGRVFESGSTTVTQNAFARRLVAARENKPGVRPLSTEKVPNNNTDATRSVATRITKSEKASLENVENIRQWQKHYRKVFPTFVFYFESIPEDVRNKCSKQIASLSAQEEKFFSRNVTHVVTTRSIPAETEESLEQSVETQNGDIQVRTINPSLLDRSAFQPSNTVTEQKKATSTNSVKREGNMDVLSRARQMGMKIWALEKLQRMILTITNGPDAQHNHNTRGNLTTTGQPRSKEEDLSQLLRKERLNGSSERDPYAIIKDLIPFKGPFIIIRDMDEKHKPVMVREYPKAAKRQDGTWPQFRSAPIGKCPFLDDPQAQREWEREREKEERDRERQKAGLLKERMQLQAPITRSLTAEPAPRKSPRMVLKQVNNMQPRTQSLPTLVESSKISDGARQLPRQPESPQKSSLAPPPFVRPSQMYFSREPAASGIQQSAITSAIRSQMISSTAAAPGAKAGLSKEVHELKRKVLEKNTGSLSAGSIPSSHRMNDLTSQLKHARAPAPQRAAKSKAQEKLGGIQEENYSEDELAMNQATTITKPKRKAAKRDPKPGYCENCRDKFDDFEEHTMSRKHRKFATTQTNWAELDTLLCVLQST